MKKNLVLLSVMVVIGLMASFGFAGAGIGMRINVPFDFYLGDQLFSNGEYNVQMDSSNDATASHVIIWATSGSGNRMLLTTPGTEKNQSVNQLGFNKYGKKCFLSTVSIGGHKATLKMQKLERELRAQMDTAPSTIAIAQK